MVGTGAADILQRTFQVVGIVGDHRRWVGILRSFLPGHRCLLGWSIPTAASAAIASALRERPGDDCTGFRLSHSTTQQAKARASA
jgi:hypothetical protein